MTNRLNARERWTRHLERPTEYMSPEHIHWAEDYDRLVEKSRSQASELNTLDGRLLHSIEIESLTRRELDDQRSANIELFRALKQLVHEAETLAPTGDAKLLLRLKDTAQYGRSVVLKYCAVFL